MGAGEVAGDAAHLTAEASDLLSIAPATLSMKHSDDSRRREDVDGEDVGPRGKVDLSQLRLMGFVNAGVVKQQVDGFVPQLLGQRGDLPVVRHVERMNGSPAFRAVGNGLQVGGGVGPAATGVNAPVGAGVLAGELQTQAAVRAGNENAWP